MGRDKLDLSGDNKKTSEWFFCANDDSRYQVNTTRLRWKNQKIQKTEKCS